MQRKQVGATLQREEGKEAESLPVVWTNVSPSVQLWSQALTTQSAKVVRLYRV